MRDNVIDYAGMRKEFLKRQKDLRRNKVVQDQQANVFSLTDEKMKLNQKKNEFWKYLMNEFLNNKETEEVVNQ